MRFSISRDKLLAPLQKVVSVVERKQTMAILSNVLLRLSENCLELTGTDLEIQLVTQADVDTGDEGEITIPARKLLDICRSLPEGDTIKFDSMQDRLSIQCGRSRFSLNTLPAGNYPAFDLSPAELTVEFSSGLLKKAMEKTLYAMAQQDVRYYLNGLMLELASGYIRTVASDGHRLALYEGVLDHELPQGRQIIIPRKGVMELFRLLGEDDSTVSTHIATNNIRIRVGNLNFSAKLIEGRFPDFQRVMPKEIVTVVTADKAMLKAALTRVAILSNEKFRGINVDVKDGIMTIESHNSEQEEAREEVEVDLEGPGVSVGFNATYLLDAINNIDSEGVRLSLTEAANSALLEDLVDQSYKFVVMPLKL